MDLEFESDPIAARSLIARIEDSISEERLSPELVHVLRSVSDELTNFLGRATETVSENFYDPS